VLTKKQEIPVVEVNLESCVHDGFAMVVKEKSESALPKFFSELIRLK